MRRSFLGQPRKGRSSLSVVGWVVVVAIGAGLVGFGFSRRRSPEEPIAPTPSATTVATTAATAIVVRTAPPTTALPSPTPPVPTPTQPQSPPTMPTVAPEVTAAPVATLVAGVDGANVRTGPDLAYDQVGYLDPGESAVITGRYGNWFRIAYAGAEGWVFSGVVTTAGAEDVPEIQLPDSSAAGSPGRAGLPGRGSQYT